MSDIRQDPSAQRERTNLDSETCEKNVVCVFRRERDRFAPVALGFSHADERGTCDLDDS
jgi:hypothetical protein